MCELCLEKETLKDKRTCKACMSKVAFIMYIKGNAYGGQFPEKYFSIKKITDSIRKLAKETGLK